MASDSETMARFTIGKVSARSGVPIETIRYYERRGLMPEPPRTGAGYRLYDDESVIRLRFIKAAQELGFILEEIGELLELRVDTGTTCDDVRRRAEHKVAEIEAKIDSLQAMRAALHEMIASCERGGPTGDCPLLDTIERQAQEGLIQ